jgi:probable F420-dependent oxidoreductase
MDNLGPLGAASPVFGPADIAAAVEKAVELEELGFATLWLPGGPNNNLPLVPAVVNATKRITVSNGILAVDRVPAAELAAVYGELAESHPGRYVPGIGGAHGPRPLATLNAYFDELDPGVPPAERVLSAMGPKMLELARDRAAAAYPNLVTPGYVASAREIVGPDTKLVVGVAIVAEADARRAREIVRGGSLPFLSGVPGYVANFRRMGFTDADITGLSDRLVDALTVWGDLDTVVAGLRAYLDAGADQVVIQVDGLPPSWPAELLSALG